MQLPYSGVQVKHWNPGASLPLILPIQVVCNTSDEVIYDNIRQNSKTVKSWMKSSPAHSKVALLCGSGPSIQDDMLRIRRMKAEGAVVFALNGCAKFLADRNIMPDYQVILDARLETADLIGPAREWLFASQVHPECFKRRPQATLWQLQVQNIDSLLPEEQPEHVLIGGAASVGNTALCLAYAMGYRTIHCFGYDSSHKEGKSHAFHQKMNDGEPCAYVDYGGKTYLCSLTMKLQAEKFQVTARALQLEGAKIEVHGYGLLPDIFNSPKQYMPEREKYERLYAMDEYRRMSPGELLVGTFLETAKPHGSVIDFGCGTGRASKLLKKAGLDVTMVDFAVNAPDLDTYGIPFLVQDLTEPLEVKADWGYCTDVMEHIPPQDVEKVITNIMGAVQKAFFQISTRDDCCGELIGQHLHLSIHDHEWWMRLFQSLGYLPIWSKEQSDTSLFIVRRV